MSPEKYSQPIAETARLRLCEPVQDDAMFFLALLNQPGWLRYIGDRGVRNLEDASRYVEERIVATHRSLGYGMYALRLRTDGTRVGLCGLVKRDFLPEPDLGFALLDRYAGQGYAEEGARAVLQHAFATLALPRVLAICKPDNRRSIALLDRLEFVADGELEAPPTGERLCRYVRVAA